MAFAECTGAASTHVLSKETSRVAYVDYGEWEGEGAENVRSLPAKGHAGMALMVAQFER